MSIFCCCCCCSQQTGLLASFSYYIYKPIAYIISSKKHSSVPFNNHLRRGERRGGGGGMQRPNFRPFIHYRQTPNWCLLMQGTRTKIPTTTTNYRQERKKTSTHTKNSQHQNKFPKKRICITGNYNSSHCRSSSAS